MKPTLPAPEILNDLSIDNWQLRWQVLEIFSRLRQQLRHHSHTSPEQLECERLSRRLAGLLNGPQDQNLQLVLTAAYFLGGYRFLFTVFRELGIDDHQEYYPGINRLKQALSETHRLRAATFTDYFQLLLCSPQAVESTTAIAAELVVQLFSPETALNLLLGIVAADTRRKALLMLDTRHPEHDFNPNIFTLTTPFDRYPELLHLVKLPLSPENYRQSLSAATGMLASSDSELQLIACQAAGRLGLTECLPRLREFPGPTTAALVARARLEDPEACRELTAAAASWRTAKRLAALPGLTGCTEPDTLARLEKNLRRGDPAEKQLAGRILALNPSPRALTVIRQRLLANPGSITERRILLAGLAEHRLAGPDPELAEHLAEWHNEPGLYPEILRVLAICGCSPEWQKIAAALKAPLTNPHLQELALFMACCFENSEIRKTLSELLFDLDWSFSYRLLIRLKPYLKGRDTALLLRKLQEGENNRGLSISELLTTTSDIPRFSDALADFLNRHPDWARKLLACFIQRLVEGELPTNEVLATRFRQMPLELQKTILFSDDPDTVHLETRLPLLHFRELLEKLPINGDNALIMVVHRTRRYHGFFRQAIIDQLLELLDHDPDLNTTEALPVLDQLLDYIRQQPGYDSLRQSLLFRMAAIRRRARDLKIHLKVIHDRDLRVISISRKNSPLTS